MVVNIMGKLIKINNDKINEYFESLLEFIKSPDDNIKGMAVTCLL
jgi:hypothetical protein